MACQVRGKREGKLEKEFESSDAVTDIKYLASSGLQFDLLSSFLVASRTKGNLIKYLRVLPLAKTNRTRMFKS